MKIDRVGIQHHKKPGWQMKRNNYGFYVLHLMWTPTVFITDSKSFLMPPHTIVLFKDNELHNYIAQEAGLTNDFVVFSASEKEVKGIPFSKPITISNPEQIQKWFQLIYSEYCTVTSCSKKTACYLLRSLLSKIRDIYSNYSVNQPPNMNVSPYQTQLEDLRIQILSAPTFDWNSKTMAEYCNISVSHFNHIYKERFSLSPRADVINLRIRYAKQLLKTNGYSVKEISDMCGYNNSTHFIRQFKDKVGMTPTEYRRKKIRP